MSLIGFHHILVPRNLDDGGLHLADTSTVQLRLWTVAEKIAQPVQNKLIPAHIIGQDVVICGIFVSSLLRKMEIVIQELSHLAKEINLAPLVSVADRPGLKLPVEDDCLLAPNYQVFNRTQSDDVSSSLSNELADISIHQKRQYN